MASPRIDVRLKIRNIGGCRPPESVSKIEIYPKSWHELLIVLLA
jgi:hypothetical protein